MKSTCRNWSWWIFGGLKVTRSKKVKCLGGLMNDDALTWKEQDEAVRKKLMLCRTG